MLAAPSEEAAVTIGAFKDAAAAAGRDPDTVGVECTIFATGDDPEAWVEEARGWLAIGASQIMFRPQGDFQTVQKAVAAFAPLLKDIA